MDERGRSIRASLAWNYGAHLLVFVVTFGGTIVLARLLTPHDLGVFGVSLAISGILGTISYFGVANYLIRDHALSDGTIATGFTINAILCLIVGAALWLLGGVGAALFADGAIPRVLRWMALVPVLGIAEFLPMTLMTRDMRFAPLSLLQLARATVNTGFAIAAGFAGYSYLSPAIGAVAGAIFGAVGFTLVGWRHVRWRISLAGWTEFVAFSAQMLSAGGVSVLAARVSELVVAHMLGLSALGYYTRASGFAAMVWDGAYGLSTRVIYVQMAAQLRETGTLKPTFLHATRLLSAIMWPAMAGIAVLSGPIIRVFYGPAWAGAALPLSLLMAGQIMAISFAMTWELCVLTGRTGWHARVEIARALAGLAVFVFGAAFNLGAAAAGRVADSLIGLAIYRPRLGELSGATPAEMRQAYRGGVLLTGLAIAPAVAMRLAWSEAAPLWHLILAPLAGGGLWLIGLALTRHPLFAEIRLLRRRDQAARSRATSRDSGGSA